MPLKKQDRYRLTVAILQKTADQIRELAQAENRSMTSYLEVLMQDVYDKSAGSEVGLSTGREGDTIQTSRKDGERG